VRQLVQEDRPLAGLRPGGETGRNEHDGMPETPRHRQRGRAIHQAVEQDDRAAETHRLRQLRLQGHHGSHRDSPAPSLDPLELN
jgi:hypothetical protein